MRREAETGASSSELAQTVAAVPPSVAVIGPAAIVPDGAKPPHVRGVSIVNAPFSRSRRSAAGTAADCTQFVTAASSAFSRGMTRSPPAPCGARQELTRMFQTALVHEGAAL